MNNNVIDATEVFIGKRILHTLEHMLTEADANLIPFYEIIEEDEIDYLELMLYDTRDGSKIVIDRAPTVVFKDRYYNNEPLFSII
jgi:hypothetical protein